MSPKRALKIAIDLMLEKRTEFAPEANLALRFGVQTPTTLKAAQRYREYSQAIDELREMRRAAPFVYAPTPAPKKRKP